MAHSLTRTLFALSLLLIAQCVAQSQTTSQKSVWPPTDPHSNTWRSARAIGPNSGKLFVVTVARPTHREACRVQSFDEDQLVCAPRHGGTSVIYRASRRGRPHHSRYRFPRARLRPRLRPERAREPLTGARISSLRL